MSGIVFFSPHPDDVEFVLGGTVLLHCNRYATKIVVMTDGGAAANGTKEIRRCETDKVAALYPNIRYTHLGFADMGISSYNEENIYLYMTCGFETEMVFKLQCNVFDNMWNTNPTYYKIYRAGGKLYVERLAKE